MESQLVTSTNGVFVEWDATMKQHILCYDYTAGVRCHVSPKHSALREAEVSILAGEVMKRNFYGYKLYLIK